jgi:hypothetical protein
MAYPGYTTPQIVTIITGVANSVGVNPATAVATAQVESGLNPTDVGDNGTSFGLYQLHQGGELGNLTEAQAFSPQTNAQVALSHMAAVQAQDPNLSPGALAAAAQRPANPASYAEAVNAQYALDTGQWNPSTTSTTTTPTTAAPASSAPSATSAAASITSPPGLNPLGWGGWLDSHVADFILIMIGVALLIVGLVVLFRQTGNLVKIGTEAAEGASGGAGAGL